MAPEFQPYGLPHLTVIFLTVVLPFALAAMVWCTKSRRLERMIISVLSILLILNYIAYLVFIRSRGVVDWREMLPMQMCDWGMVVVIVAMWTGNQRWFEVAYFWGIGGDRKSTRLNSSHTVISYAVFCLKKKNGQARPVVIMQNNPTLMH